MKQAQTHILTILALFMVLSMMNACSCSRPDSEEMYVNDRQKDAYGQFVFQVDLSEPLRSYNLSLVTNLTCSDREFVSFDHLPFHLLWQSPTGALYEEDVFFNRDHLIGGDYYTKQLSASYWENMIPKERGIWEIKVSVPDSSAFSQEVQGVGLRIVRN